MNSINLSPTTQSPPKSSTKPACASVAIVVEAERPAKATAVCDATMEQLSEQMRQNLIRNVAEAQSRPLGDPAEWEI